MTTMRAARLHDSHSPLRIDDVEIPSLRPTDVLVRVEACGIVPNLANILTAFDEVAPNGSLPPLPAVFGLDAAGVIAVKGDQVRGMNVGDRVYVNPARYCGACRACRAGRTAHCEYYLFNGYFGFTPKSREMVSDYPHGGLCEYLAAPQYSLVALPDSVSFEEACRFGYLGTGFRALKKAGVRPGDVVLVNGVSGTLGLGVALLALAMGAGLIIGTGRDAAKLERVKEIAPDRIAVYTKAEATQSLADYAAELTDGVGVDTVVDCLANGSPAEPFLEALAALGRGGSLVNIGAVGGAVPITMHELMEREQHIYGSIWFTTEQAEEMAALAATELLNLSHLEHRVFPLEKVNEAIQTVVKKGNGGFDNFVVNPQL
ncbi:alcohol dehydrogenase catalytic domain-containing protein [Rhodococcus sp. NPDC057014]|uniref:alcohol dehydrogenase catalytic domain-containing protein n=1 Tax=Rhodococcus sp. NPDC057014 TaxID=3346000 RepID=UPI0036418B70